MIKLDFSTVFFLWCSIYSQAYSSHQAHMVVVVFIAGLEVLWTCFWLRVGIADSPSQGGTCCADWDSGMTVSVALDTIISWIWIHWCGSYCLPASDFGATRLRVPGNQLEREDLSFKRIMISARCTIMGEKRLILRGYHLGTPSKITSTGIGQMHACCIYSYTLVKVAIICTILWFRRRNI